MKRNLIVKLITGSVITTTLFTGIPFKAKGQWKVDGQGNYYFYEGTGYSSGWRNIDGKVYFFDDNGVMKKGWINYDDSWYFLDNTGALKIGWINFNNNWYYSDSAGRIQSGIINIDGKTYYFAENGVMQTKNTIINNQFCTIGSDGVIVGNNIPVPNRVYDSLGNCIQSDLSSNDIKVSPIESMSAQPTSDHSEVGDYDAPTRKFTVKFRSYNGEELEDKTVKEGNTIKAIDADSREGYEFIEWNTKSDGSGKSYDEGDKIKVNSDMNLYPIYKKEEEVTLVNSIIISGEKEVEIGKEIQLNAEVKPSSATDTKVKWSVTNNGGEATVDSNGCVKGIKEGDIVVKAEAQDKSGESAEYKIKVVQAKIQTQLITIKGTSNVIDTNGGTLQLNAEIKPENSDNQNVRWEIVGSGSKYASIDTNGVVTAIADGEIDVVAHAKDGSGVTSDKYHITISNQKVKPLYIIVSGSKNEDSVAIGSDRKIKMVANIDKIGQSSDVEWSVDNEDIATINASTGELEGIKKGSVIVTAKYNDGVKTITGTKKIKVVQPVEEIIIQNKDTEETSGFKIDTNKGILNLKAEAIGRTGSDPDNTSVTWTVSNPELAFIDSKTGRLTAIKDGTVDVIASANDGYGATTSAAVTISNQKVSASEIKLYDDAGNNITDSDESKVPLELICNSTTQSAVTIKAITDDRATDRSIEWSIISGNQYVDSNITKQDIIEDGKVIGSTIKIIGKKPTPSGQAVVVKAASKDGLISVTKMIHITKNISNIEFEKNTINGVVGSTIDVTAFIHDSDATNKQLEWTVIPVGGEQCASIEVNDKQQITTVNGIAASIQKIHLIKEGQAKVIVKAQDGSGVNTVEHPLVINIMPLVQGITINVTPNSGSLNIGDSVTLSADITPTNAMKDVHWRLENITGEAELIKNGDNETLIAKKAGAVKVVVTSDYGTEELGESEKIFTIIDPTPTGSDSNNGSN